MVLWLLEEVEDIHAALTHYNIKQPNVYTHKLLYSIIVIFIAVVIIVLSAFKFNNANTSLQTGQLTFILGQTANNLTL